MTGAEFDAVNSRSAGGGGEDVERVQNGARANSTVHALSRARVSTRRHLTVCGDECGRIAGSGRTASDVGVGFGAGGGYYY